MSDPSYTKCVAMRWGADRCGKNGGLAMRILLAMAVLTAIPLAGCGEGSTFDKGFKKSYREQFVEKCRTEMAAAAARAVKPVAAVDFAALCGCIADRTMEGRNAIELINPSEEQLNQVEAATDLCVADLSKRPAANKAGG